MTGEAEKIEILREIRDRQKESLDLQKEQFEFIKGHYDRAEAIQNKAEALQDRAGRMFKLIAPLIILSIAALFFLLWRFYW